MRSLLLLAVLCVGGIGNARGLASVNHLRAPSSALGLASADALRHRSAATTTLPSARLLNELRGGGVVGLWQKYETLLDKEPLKTRIWTGFFISIVGDVICQYITKGDSANWVLDLKRMFVFATWGAIGFTPLAFKWYGGMETAVPANIPYRFLVKTVLDQTVFSTGVTMLTFITLTIVEGLLVGFDWKMGSLPVATKTAILPIPTILQQGVTKVKNLLWPTLLENWKVWPAVQVLNFSIVPVKFQVLFVNIVAIWWNFILSLMQHK